MIRSGFSFLISKSKKTDFNSKKNYKNYKIINHTVKDITGKYRQLFKTLFIFFSSNIRSELVLKPEPSKMGALTSQHRPTARHSLFSLWTVFHSLCPACKAYSYVPVKYIHTVQCSHVLHYKPAASCSQQSLSSSHLSTISSALSSVMPTSTSSCLPSRATSLV